MPWRARNHRAEAEVKTREQQRQRARPTAQQRGYDYVWSLFSQRWLRTHPICGEQYDGTISDQYSACARAGVLAPAEVTDHILSMAKGGEKYDPHNLQSLCRACNSLKMRQYES